VHKHFLNPHHRWLLQLLLNRFLHRFRLDKWMSHVYTISLMIPYFSFICLLSLLFLFLLIFIKHKSAISPLSGNTSMRNKLKMIFISSSSSSTPCVLFGQLQVISFLLFQYGTSLSKNKSNIYSLTKSQSNTNHKLTQ